MPATEPRQRLFCGHEKLTLVAMGCDKVERQRCVHGVRLRRADEDCRRSAGPRCASLD